MSHAHQFRHILARRILAMLALSLPAASTPGCIFGTSCPDDPQLVTNNSCFTWTEAEMDGGLGGSFGVGGSGGAGGMGGAGGSEPIACPSRDVAAEKFKFIYGTDPTVKSDGVRKGDECCYTIEYYPLCEGRPYLVENIARTADAVKIGEKRGWGEALAPNTENIDAAARAILAAEWTRDALLEHASVASFGRFALELLAAGAPADLVEAAHQAALDEVRHARLCFALASAYAGEPVAPGVFPFEGRVEIEANLASIAARAAKEGCIGETIAASIAAEQLASAEDPAVRQALEQIAADEARHAELAWRTVAWALRVGGAEVREALEMVFSRMECGAFTISEAVEDGSLSAHGRIGGEAMRQSASRAIEEVVLPAARVLLARVRKTSEPLPQAVLQ